MENFEKFLQEQHAEDYHGTDDDMPDDFDNWVADLQVDDLIRYANIYGIEENMKGMEKAKEIALEAMKDLGTNLAKQNG